nr:MAG TPA: hypothetical protein [Caudoviricetes sp.]DAH91136.1 MAG TPA: hypothetical protein [Caudoviricetes sp.]DAZ42223.1 MAG TPA: hypothetical protein [Caudoviricetes sp.]DAZ61360.1 MAG TPA: hypothetical protein [Caudoviricetes sp.]
MRFYFMKTFILKHTYCNSFYIRVQLNQIFYIGGFYL